MRASTCEEGRGAVVAASSCEAASLGRETTEAGAAASGPVRLIHLLSLLGLNIKGRLLADKNFKPEEERRRRVRLDHTRLQKGQDVRIKAGYELYRKMITKFFEDYPEHRLKFFSLLRAIGTHCFKALIQLSSQQLKLVIDSINWAFRHRDRNIAETGLSLLLEILKNFQASEFTNQFYKTYFLNIEQEIFAVLTDSFHKPGFKLHVLVLQHLFYVISRAGVSLVFRKLIKGFLDKELQPRT